MADPVSKDRCSHTSGAVATQVFRVSGLYYLVVDSEVSNIASCVGTRNFVKWDTRALETLKDSFEELPLLWIHIRGLEVIDTEKAILEGTRVLIEKVATLGVHTAWPIYPIRMVEGVSVEPRAGNIALSRTSVR